MPIKTYQFFISPLVGNCCRFYPSCSNYAIEALTQHNLLVGVFLTVKRILKCNPMCAGGFDPVPLKKEGD